MLINPVQRVPRYVLLFGEIVKHTDENDQCGIRCRQALLLIRLLAALIDKKQQDLDNLARIADIQSLVNPPVNLAESGRQLVEEGWLIGYEDGVAHYYYCFLFSDILLLTRQGKDTTHVSGDLPVHRAHIYLKNVQVDDLPDTPSTLFHINASSREWSLQACISILWTRF